MVASDGYWYPETVVVDSPWGLVKRAAQALTPAHRQGWRACYLSGDAPLDLVKIDACLVRGFPVPVMSMRYFDRWYYIMHMDRAR